MKTGRCMLIVLDSLGAGAMADCADQRPQDENANTLRSVLKYIGKTDLPVLSQLGLRHINAQVDSECLGHYGRVKLQHEGADSYLGHQEIMGSKVKKTNNPAFLTTY